MVKHNKVDDTKTKSRVGLIVMLAMLVVAIVALVVGIVVVRNNTDDGYVANMDEVESAYDVDGLASEIINKFKNGDYSLDEAENELTRLIDVLNDDEKIYAVTSYAYFVFGQTGNIDKSIKIMENAYQYVNDNTKAGYYTSIGRLYEEAKIYDQSSKYYNMASELYAERNIL